MDKLWYLSRINIMQGVPQAQLQDLDHHLPMQHAPAGTLVMLPDTPRDALYLLKRGAVRIFRLTPDGRELTLAVLGEGNVFGEVESFVTGTAGHYVQTLNPSLICVLRKPDFDRLLEEHPQVARNLIDVLTHQLHEAQEMMAHMALSSIRVRILHLLLKLAESFGQGDDAWRRLTLPLSHQEIATMVGSTRETVTTVLSALAADGVVRTGRRALSVHIAAARKALEGL